VLATSRQPIHLVLVDVVMPVVGGVALARLIREEWPAVRILFMSAYPAEILVREGLDHPNVFFLAKPFTRSELMDRVVTALRGHPEHDVKAFRTPRLSS
jgi:two-component system cell cycle sensor histidine kinase/response regulator CckA